MAASAPRPDDPYEWLRQAALDGRMTRDGAPRSRLVLTDEEWAALREWLGPDDDDWLRRLQELAASTRK